MKFTWDTLLLCLFDFDINKFAIFWNSLGGSVLMHMCYLDHLSKWCNLLRCIQEKHYTSVTYVLNIWVHKKYISDLFKYWDIWKHILWLYMHPVQWIVILWLWQVLSDNIYVYWIRCVCLLEKTLCDPIPCKNGGICMLIDGGSNYRCNCTYCSCAVSPTRNCDIRMYTVSSTSYIYYFITTRISELTT